MYQTISPRQSRKKSTVGGAPPPIYNGSPFDTTNEFPAAVRPPSRATPVRSPPNPNVFSRTQKTPAKDPKDFLLRNSGFGGSASTAYRARSASPVAQFSTRLGVKPVPPKADPFAPRENPANTTMRRLYERGDLPCRIEHGLRRTLVWRVPEETLDLKYYLPIFFDGIREEEEPYCTIAEQGVDDLLRIGGEDRVLPILPRLIVPIRNALNTRRRKVVIRTLLALQNLSQLGSIPTLVAATGVPFADAVLPPEAMQHSSPVSGSKTWGGGSASIKAAAITNAMTQTAANVLEHVKRTKMLPIANGKIQIPTRIGVALVPYYRQILPVLNLYFTRAMHLGDQIDYGQRFRRDLCERVNDVLETLEAHGGPHALVNIVYMVPTYTSAFRN